MTRCAILYNTVFTDIYVGMSVSQQHIIICRDTVYIVSAHCIYRVVRHSITNSLFTKLLIIHRMKQNMILVNDFNVMKNEYIPAINMQYIYLFG